MTLLEKSGIVWSHTTRDIFWGGNAKASGKEITYLPSTRTHWNQKLYFWHLRHPMTFLSVDNCLWDLCVSLGVSASLNNPSRRDSFTHHFKLFYDQSYVILLLRWMNCCYGVLFHKRGEGFIYLFIHHHPVLILSSCPSPLKFGFDKPIMLVIMLSFNVGVYIYIHGESLKMYNLNLM